MLDYLLSFVPASSGNQDTTVYNIISVISGLAALLCTILVFLLRRKWALEREVQESKDKNTQLSIENVSSVLEPRLDGLVQQIAKLESDITVNIKNSLEKGIFALRKDLDRFKDRCTAKHDALASLGNIDDLKRRVDKLSDKLERLQDKVTDKYVTIDSYRQDTKILAQTITAFRADLRTMMELVEKIS